MILHFLLKCRSPESDVIKNFLQFKPRFDDLFFFHLHFCMSCQCEIVLQMKNKNKNLVETKAITCSQIIQNI